MHEKSWIIWWKSKNSSRVKESPTLAFPIERQKLESRACVETGKDTPCFKIIVRIWRSANIFFFNAKQQYLKISKSWETLINSMIAKILRNNMNAKKLQIRTAIFVSKCVGIFWAWECHNISITLLTKCICIFFYMQRGKYNPWKSWTYFITLKLLYQTCKRAVKNLKSNDGRIPIIVPNMNSFKDNKKCTNM